MKEPNKTLQETTIMLLLGGIVIQSFSIDWELKTRAHSCNPGEMVETRDLALTRRKERISSPKLLVDFTIWYCGTYWLALIQTYHSPHTPTGKKNTRTTTPEKILLKALNWLDITLVTGLQLKHIKFFYHSTTHSLVFGCHYILFYT